MDFTDERDGKMEKTGLGISLGYGKTLVIDQGYVEEWGRLTNCSVEKAASEIEEIGTSFYKELSDREKNAPDVCERVRVYIDDYVDVYRRPLWAC